MPYLKAILFWIKFWILTVSMYLALWVFRFYYLITRKKNFDSFVHSYSVIWAKIIMNSTPGWSVSITGKENIPADHSRFVIVANHESLTDIWIIFLLGVQFRWLAKAELFKVPIIGRPMGWAGYIPVNRGNRTSASQAMEQSAKTVQSGIPMLFFPEGTRSDTGEMKQFKVGAFKLAADTNTGVLPIVLKGARQLIPKGSWVPSKSHVKMHILPSTMRLDGEDIEVYAARVRSEILDTYLKL